MPLPSPYRNPGRWRAVVFRQEVRHGTAGCLLSLILLAPLLVREWGLTPVLVGIVFYSSVIVPAITGYFSFAKLLLRVARSLVAVFLLFLPNTASDNGYAHLSNRGRTQEVAVPGALYLLLLLGIPFVLYLLRPRPSLLAPAALCYLLVVLPRALGPQLPQASSLWLPRTLAAVLLTRGWTASLGRWVAGVLRGVVVGVRFLLVGLVRGCVVLPVSVSVAVILALHETYMSLYGARITANQVVFFLMVQELVTPWAHLTSLYFLLFYTVLVYIHRALFGRHWAMRVQVGQSRDLARLAVWYIATRLGKGVAMSFVLVMFTLQFSHVEPDLTFISVTFTYFVLTQHKWTGEELVITWIRALRLPPLEEEEDFWVPLGALVLPLAVSAGVAVVVAPSRPWLAVVAAYTNLLVPGLLVAQRVAGRDSPHAAVLTSCRKATPKELEDRPTCPVCLEELRQARVTPCLHLYHASCLASCLAHSSLCPLCKQPI